MHREDDMISRQAAIDCVTYDEEYTIECLKELPSEQPEIIRCRDCRWWGYDGDDGPVRVCHAAKHGHMSSHWDIQIYRKYRENFYCADAERREDE